MSRYLTVIERWLVAILLLLSLALGFAVDHYRDKARRVGGMLTTLQQQVRQQNREAQDRLAELTRQRDAKQAALDALHAHQEQTDAAATLEIARLESELATRPVRVRVVTQPAACGRGGAGAAGGATTAVNSGDPDGAKTYGLLPDANSRRLGAVIAEAETINAAYASCRARLLVQEQ